MINVDHEIRWCYPVDEAGGDGLETTERAGSA
jgi:hypothetical protein